MIAWINGTDSSGQVFDQSGEHFVFGESTGIDDDRPTWTDEFSDFA